MPKFRILRTWPSKHNFRRGQVIEDPPLRNIGSLKRLKYIEEIGGKPVPKDRPKKVVEAEAKVKERRAKTTKAKTQKPETAKSAAKKPIKKEKKDVRKKTK